jgi:hypothetical protein
MIFRPFTIIDDVVKVQLGCGMAARHIGSLALGKAADCEALRSCSQPPRVRAWSLMVRFGRLSNPSFS